MLTKQIKFKAHKLITQDKSLHPVPGRYLIPEWYKNIKGDLKPSSIRSMNIKHCKPFLDTLMAGYLIKNPIDQIINFNVPNPNKDNKLDTWININSEIQEHPFVKIINLNRGHEVHPLEQIGGESCPYAKTNKMWAIYKILNPWTIDIPKGYSVLFTPPLNRPNDNLEILSGIVDSGHPAPTNFPCVFKKEGTWLLEKGTPIATVFPFKIENWKMTIEEQDNEKRLKEQFSFFTKIFKHYHKFNWVKKSWK
jgi:hypothetical protein